MKKYLAGLSLFSLFILPILVSGQQSDIDPNPTTGQCTLSSTNLRYRARDAGTNGEVSALQDFLQSRNYLSSEPTGYFGLMTLNAVKAFQRANSIDPTGYVGPLTRGKINTFCINGGGNSTNNSVGTGTISQIPANPIDPYFAKGPNRVTYVTCGDTYKFTVGNLQSYPTTVYLEQTKTKDGVTNKTYDGLIIVPNEYTSVCNTNRNDVGTYVNTISTINSDNTKGTTLGSTTFTILPLPSATIIPNTPMSITTSSLSNARVGQLYSNSLLATGGTGSYSWALNSNTPLPTGLSLSVLGVITGTPTIAGNYNFTVAATSGSQVADRQFNLIVDPATTSTQNNTNTNTATTNTTTSTSTSIPVATLTITPKPVTAGQNITYTWNSTNATSWEWSIGYMIDNRPGHLQQQAEIDACGTVKSQWRGPTGGNSASGTVTLPTLPCQAGYTYYIYYKAKKDGGLDAQAGAIVEVLAPTTTSSAQANQNLADVLYALQATLDSLKQSLGQ